MGVGMKTRQNGPQAGQWTARQYRDIQSISPGKATVMMSIGS